jgi:hypothetical protein
MRLAGRWNSTKKEIALYLLLGLPTVAVMGYAIFYANQFFALLQNQWQRQTLNYALGLLIGLSIFSRRFRFVPLTALLLLAHSIIGYSISRGLTGEFDAYFWTVKYSTSALLFFVGWCTGYGFARARFFSVVWSLLLLAAMAVVVATVSVLKSDQLVVIFAPTLLYCFYIIYTSELLRNLNEDEPRLLWMLTKRLAGFGLLLLLLIAGLMQYYKPQLEAVEKEWGSAQKKEDNNPTNSLTRNDGTGSTNNNSMGLGAFNNKPNKDSVLFVAKLDNFFPDGKTPNPLYFVSNYYSKFDTTTQTFEIDSLRPYNDLFSPDVSQIPLYFTKADTSVLIRAMSRRNRRIATVEVYKHNLSARLFTAPSTAFFVQPISVPDENKDIYRSAYRAKMLVSDLNSAYFVYNPAGDAALDAFQQQRFEVLRRTNSYAGLPQNFLQYYTYMPAGADYDSIRSLTASIVAQAGAKTIIDKVLAVRDYFLKKDENGEPTFKYSDNPGVPGMPSANKLTYFLFQNKKGYCAYYAGATLFMLRSLGIPSRIATGFLTVDRSNKNPGWYWFYEDQAHAWVQVYFPEYGWLDFDTTVPDLDQQQAPQPDQTPPLASQTAWLVANGKATSIDTASKRATMQVEKLLYWDQPYEVQPTTPMEMDLSLAKVLHDTGTVQLSQLKPGDNIVAVSYSLQFKELPPQEADSAASLMQRFPKPAPIDEIKIMLSEEEKAALDHKKTDTTPTNWPRVLWTGLAILGGLLLLALCLPWLAYRWLRIKAAGAKDARRYYWQYHAMMFYLHQMGIERHHQSPLQYAQQQVDARFGTRLADYVNVYLKLKYAQQPLTDREAALANTVYAEVLQQVNAKLKPGYRFSHFINLRRSLQYITKPSMYA